MNSYREMSVRKIRAACFKRRTDFAHVNGRNSCGKCGLAAHDKKRLVFKAGELRSETLGVVVLLDIHVFLGGSNRFYGDVAIAAVMENDEAAMVALQEQLKSDIAVSHGNDGVHDIGVAATREIAELLIDHFNGFAFVEFDGELLDFVGDEIADAA